MGNTNGTCNLAEAVEAARQGPLAAHLKPMCRCPLGGTFLRDYVYRPFQYSYTYACAGNCSANDTASIMGINAEVTNMTISSDNQAISYSAINPFPLCYETFTLLPNQVVEAPVLIAVAALFYLLVLLYLFVGVALIADRFMASIEVITSVTRKVTLPKTKQVIEVRVWNDTVSNLTLMALGSSAPEILLSLIELISTAPRFAAGSLGPSTIVGSAAFNLLLITAVIVSCLPKGETRQIRGLLVFAITAFFSIFAYIWLLFILVVITPNVIDVAEAVITLLFFPLLVGVAYLMDKKFFLYRCFKNIREDSHILKLQAGIMGRGDISHGVIKVSKANNEDEVEEAVDGVVLRKVTQQTDIIKGDQGETLETERLVPDNQEGMEVQLEKLLLRRVKEELKNSDVDMKGEDVTLNSDAQQRIADSLSHKLYGTSRAAYRVNATRLLTGGRRVIRSKAQPQTDGEAQPAAKRSKIPEGATGVGFGFTEISCLENCGHIDLTVERIGSNNTKFEVEYRTEDIEAKAGDDYEATAGNLVFEVGDLDKTISVNIVDDDEFEPTERFRVVLFNARFPTSQNDSSPSVKAEMLPLSESISDVIILEDKRECLVSILDDDHHGKFEWHEKVYQCQESDGVVFARIQRTEGARGRVQMRVVTIKGTAKPGSDYLHYDEIVTFDDEETYKDIEIKIHDDDEYEKKEEFYIRMCNLEDMNETPGGDGAAFLGDNVKCTVEITEDHLFKSRSDKILSNIRLGAKLGTRNWRHQFKDALYPNGRPDPEDITLGTPDKPSFLDWFFHVLSFPFKIIFSLVPPPSYLYGWPCFVFSIVAIGLLTAFIGDMANAFGCAIDLRNEVTAITLVAIGTSLPDTFASKIAAVNDDTADNSIGNITGSNSVNVFLGVGIAWTVGAFAHLIIGTPCGFVVPAGSLGFSVLLFCICAVIYLFVMILRRVVKPIAGAELGGPLITRIPTSIFFLCLWVVYILLSSLQTYGYINPGF